jgi:hypothetical protein
MKLLKNIKKIVEQRERDNKVIMVEHIDDNNNWAWYAVIKGTTPKKAIEWYLSEQGLEDNVIQQKDGWYSEEENVRAYEISLTTI